MIYWDSILENAYILNRSKKYSRLCYHNIAAILRIIQGDSKVSTHGENGLYLQNVIYVGTITLTAHTVLLSHPWRTRCNIQGVTCADASLIRSFRWSLFCVFTWYAMAFKSNQKLKKKIKWSEVWRPRWPMQGTTATNPMNTNGVQRFHTPCIGTGVRGGVVVKALRHKPAGRGFDSRCCHWKFSVT